MNTLVIYDSAYGNTEKIAKAIAETLGEYGQAQALRVRHTHPLVLQGVNLLILGCPTQGWKPTSEMQSLLDYLPPEALDRLTIVCFDTRFNKALWMTGSSAKFMTRRLRQREATHLLPSKSFFVKGMQGPLEEGELARAVEWAKGLVDESRMMSAQGQEASSQRR